MAPGGGPFMVGERQITTAPHGHILTNIGVWSADGQWIVYDVRTDAAGDSFDGTRIERVHASTGRVETLFNASRGACCGVAIASPIDDRVVFIHGPEHPTPQWHYAAWHRRGVIVHANAPDHVRTLDARDLTEPFTPGALRGGTHVHTFSGDGEWIAFTYEDHVLAELGEGAGHDENQRNVGVSIPAGPVVVDRDHPRNHDGTHPLTSHSRSASVGAPRGEACVFAPDGKRIAYVRPVGERAERRNQGFVLSWEESGE